MNRDQARCKAQRLVEQMTLEEAVSQLRYDAPAIERLGIPAYNWWNEALHGVARGGTATSFPQAIGLAATFDPALVHCLGNIAAEEGRAKYNAAVRHNDRMIYKGLTFWAPNVNIFRDPRWGRGHETYGEDPFLTAEMGKAYVRGLQGDGETMKAAACAKHFAVHSGPEDQRHFFNAQASERDMAETYLPAFRALVQEAGVEAVMGAYNRTNGEPCCGSQALMVDILREKWGFQGHYVSDCWAVMDFHLHHGVTATPEESAALALRMGCDLNCGSAYRYLMDAWEQDLVTEEEIRLAATRLFTTRYLLGIMEGCEYDTIPFSRVECPEHLQAAHQAALESCVLLKNDGLLPLQTEKISTLAVIGPNANSRQALIGNYYGTSSRYITVLEGLQQELEDKVRVVYSEGCTSLIGRKGQQDDRLSEAVIAAEEADAVVLVVGLDETLEGEEGDRGNEYASGDKKDLLLPLGQRKMMDAVLAVGKPTVIVLLAGSAIDLEEAADKANAVLLGWYPGARGGKAVAELLLGKASPSGKLPVTFYYNHQLDEMPAFTDYAMEGRTYRYVRNAPRYPFGFGLTYGQVRMLSARREGNSVHVRLTNDGGMDTWDVVQLYIDNPGSGYAPKHPRLAAFQRVFCPVGKEIETELQIPEDAWLLVNEHGQTVNEGERVVYAGLGQPEQGAPAIRDGETIRWTDR